MAKIGVVANHNTVNYGTMLQAFATQTMLERLGYEVETINFSGLNREITRKKLDFFNSHMSKWDLLRAKGPTLTKKIAEYTHPDFRKNCEIRNLRFAEFRNNEFPMSPSCASREELTEQSKHYDVVLVGSDQVWLPSNIAADVFTLSFVPDEIKKVAYAASFGVAELPLALISDAKRFISRFHSLSVREKSGQKIVRGLIGRTIPVVADPTMLFTAQQWNQMFPWHGEEKEPYIFTYFLGNNPWQRAFVREFAQKSHFIIISILHMDEFIPDDEKFADEARYAVGPAEFLDLIRGAAYVFTDSFHGTVISTLFQRNIFTFDRFPQNASYSTNTRIDSLFSLTGLIQRRLTKANSPKDCIKMTVDFGDALDRINLIRNESIDYLSAALRG